MSITPDNSPKQAGSPDRQHTDIDLSGWWRHLPSGCHPYILVARLDRPIGWWLLLLPGWWVIPVAAPGIGAGFFLMALFLAGAVAMRAAGCVVNDLWDRRLDSQVERTAGRPLAAGTIGSFEALLFLGLLCAIGLTVLVQLPFFAILTGIASLPLVILYPLAKRVTWWPQAVLGLTFSWGVPLGWAAASGSPPPAALALVYAGSVAWVFGYDTIYAIQDMADDREVGVKSSALGLGRHLRAGVATAYALAVAGLGLGFWLLLGTGIWVAALVAMALHLAWQSYRLDAGDPAMALRLFKSNRDAGLILTAGLVINQIAA
ncbi:MAG: 4-hydroxybenzoate octaprenyltransferase [Pseudomonadota bacterium]|nr:4-hydroxybenzoate octaprenyltransferase [Pseudomonadota bacterium]